MTNKIALRTVEEFMAGYVPVYQPIYPLFLTKSTQYPSEVGQLNFRRSNTVGDIRAKHITPKDTEIRQVSVMEGKKAFKKYFLANQFTLSDVQDREGVEEIQAQVLDEHQIQMDELMLLGEGTSNSTMINNGLFWSNDPNYVLNDSIEIKKGTATDYLLDFYKQILVTTALADQIAGRKIIVIYGLLAKALATALFPVSNRTFRSALEEGLGPNYSVVLLPNAPTPSNTNGWIIANLDQVKLHYTALPAVLAHGHNEEKMYIWTNFMMGSAMLEVLALYGIIRQPITLEA